MPTNSRHVRVVIDDRVAFRSSNLPDDIDNAEAITATIRELDNRKIKFDKVFVADCIEVSGPMEAVDVINQLLK